MGCGKSARRVRSAGSVSGWDKGLEPLEPRVFLSNTPMPKLTDMEEQNNTLVRMETDFGTIDLEMFDIAGPDGGVAAPNTGANFLDHITQHAHAQFVRAHPSQQETGRTDQIHAAKVGFGWLRVGLDLEARVAVGDRHHELCK